MISKQKLLIKRFLQRSILATYTLIGIATISVVTYTLWSEMCCFLLHLFFSNQISINLLNRNSQIDGKCRNNIHYVLNLTSHRVMICKLSSCLILLNFAFLCFSAFLV